MSSRTSNTARSWLASFTVLLFFTSFASAARGSAHVLRRNHVDAVSSSVSTSATTSGIATAPPPSNTQSTSANSTTTSTVSTSSSASTVLPSNFALPKPFDTSIGTNFTSSSCPAYFNLMLSDPNFQSCLPFSLLLQNSASFFHDEQQLSTLDATLKATCNVNFPSCQSTMSSYATGIRASSACGPDYSLSNPLVIQAYNGLVAYSPMYTAACLKADPTDDDTATQPYDYCYTAALLDSESPADAFIYDLPLGIPLTTSSVPTCSPCLQQTMAVFASAAANLTQPVSNTYVGAANQINARCGPNFVSASVKPISGSGGTTSGAGMLSVGRAGMVMLVMGGVAAWAFTL